MQESIDRREFVAAVVMLIAAATVPARVELRTLSPEEIRRRSQLSIRIMRLAVDRAQRIAGVTDPTRPLMDPREYGDEIVRQGRWVREKIGRG